MKKHRIENCIDENNRETGFTLIEVMIALCVFLIGVLAIASVQTSSTGANTTARMVTRASTYAVDQMERLLNMNYANAALANGATGNRTEGPYIISWSVQNNPGTANTRFVTVNVTSNHPSIRRRNITLISLKSQSM